MKGIRLVAFGLLAPAVCFAQTTDNASPAAATSTETPAQATTNPAPVIPPGFTPPSPTGAPHVCGNLYPPLAVRLGMQGTTELSFVIGVDGKVSGITVAQSSGYDVLDQVAIQCVSTWLYKPATQNGQPIAVPRQVKVRWILHSLDEASFVPPLPLIGSTPHVCDKPGDTSSVSQPTILTFDVDDSGRVSNVVAQQSSGNAAADQHAADCVSKWRYAPARFQGRTIPFSLRETFPWTDSYGESLPQNLTLPEPDVTPPSCSQSLPKGYSGPFGLTELSFRVAIDGSVKNVTVSQSSGNSSLDDIAVQCVYHWHYKPASQDGQPLEMVWQGAVNWQPGNQ